MSDRRCCKLSVSLPLRPRRGRSPACIQPDSSAGPAWLPASTHVGRGLQPSLPQDRSQTSFCPPPTLSTLCGRRIPAYLPPLLRRKWLPTPDGLRVSMQQLGLILEATSNPLPPGLPIRLPMLNKWASLAAVTYHPLNRGRQRERVEHLSGVQSAGLPPHRELVGLSSVRACAWKHPNSSW